VRHAYITQDEIRAWLKEDDEARLEDLWRRADAVRREHVGDDVHLRGLVEFSNRCVRQCAYCGLRAGNRKLVRYRMSEAEIMDCARQAMACGYGTVVLQSGEDPGIETDWIAALIRRIRSETPLVVTLSLGEQPEKDLSAWREAGADRYLLKFETSNKRLYERLHPPLKGKSGDRIAMLHTLRDIGYETGSGTMVGLPGQTFEDVVEDVELFRGLDLDMIGIGPYIPHLNTPLGRNAQRVRACDGEQVPNTDQMTCKVVALARIVCPAANIPSTTALATLNPTEGRELGLMRGANIVMINIAPLQYRVHYEIYPSRMSESDEAIRHRILTIGRKIGVGRGDSPNRLRRVRSVNAAGKI